MRSIYPDPSTKRLIPKKVHEDVILLNDIREIMDIYNDL